MNVVLTKRYGGNESVDLAGYVESVIQQTNYDTRGEAETAREIADNAAFMLSKLVAVLVESDKLTEDELNEVVACYPVERISIP